MIVQIKSFFLENSIIKNSSMIFIASLIGSLALFFASILIARFFGPQDFANFKIATNLFIFLPSLIELGIGVTMTKYIAEYSVSQKEKIPHLILYFLKLRTISFAILIVALFLLKDQIAILFFDSAAFEPLVIAGLWISSFIFFEIFKQISLGFQEFKTYALSQFLVLFFSGILSLALGYFFGVFWAIIGWAIAYFIGNLPGMWLTMKKVSSIKYREFETKGILFSYSLPMFSLIIPSLPSIALVPLVSLFFQKELVGLFAFAMIFYNGANFIPSALTTVLLPQVSEAQGKKSSPKKILFSFMKRYTLIAIPCIIIVLLITGPFIKIVSPGYLQGTIVTETMIILCLLLGYFSMVGTYYTGLEKVRQNWILTIIRNIILVAVAFAGLLSLA